jgi:hypothetical protein
MPYFDFDDFDPGEPPDIDHDLTDERVAFTVHRLAFATLCALTDDEALRRRYHLEAQVTLARAAFRALWRERLDFALRDYSDFRG